MQARGAPGALGGDDEGAGDHGHRMREEPGVRQVDPLQGGVVADALGGVAVRRLPEVLAGVHVDGDDAAVRGLEDGQPLRPPEVAAVQHRELGDGAPGGLDILGHVDEGARHDVL